MNSDNSQQLQERVLDAYKSSYALNIIGGNSKSFYGRHIDAKPLQLSSHRGVINYEPTELVITVRAGTPLSDIESLLAENGQMLAFEPPAYAATATIGGTIACNLSGPRRAYAGAARDYLLGCRIINGKGQIMHFGGEVMKNVAGYDVSRLMAGAMGTLGVLLEVSLKVLPRPEQEITKQINCSADRALEKLHQWSQTPIPISASSFHGEHLHIRLSGATRAVNTAAASIGGDTASSKSHYWQQLKEQQLNFFRNDLPLWRISVASDTETAMAGAGHDTDVLYEWGGALRWVSGILDAEQIQQTAANAGGHAMLFRGNSQTGLTAAPFQPLSSGLLRIHQNLKRAFDPENILNPEKLYPGL
jgi:glycolate oxidase FAD binding subunit